MTRHLTPATLVNWLAALIFVLVFFGVIYQVDQAGAEADRLHMLAKAANATEQRLQRAAQALCTAELGAHTTVVWTADNVLVCRPTVLTAKTEGNTQ